MYTMTDSHLRKILGGHIITAVLVLRTVIPPEDGFPADVSEAVWLEMTRLLTLKVLHEEIPGYREALGHVLISEFGADPWDRVMTLEDAFQGAVTNLARLGISPLVLHTLLREHAIEGDPATLSIVRRRIKMEDVFVLQGLAVDCMDALGIHGDDRRDIGEDSLDLYESVFDALHGDR